MRELRGCVAAAFAVTLFASGCGGATVTPTASPGATATASAAATATAAASATPTAGGSATASPSSAVSGFYLRSWTLAPVGPQNSFGNVPLVISDGQVLTVKYAPAGDPYPLYAPPTRRTLSQAGLATVVAEAQNDGLLGTVTSFECPHDPNAGMMAGTGTDHLVVIVGGVTHEITSSCPYEQPTPGPGAPAPATWAAFQHFKKLLSDPSSWLGAEAGPETTYDARRLAVLAGNRDVSAETPNPANVVQWPLAPPFASFGVAVLRRPLRGGRGLGRRHAAAGREGGHTKPRSSATAAAPSQK